MGSVARILCIHIQFSHRLLNYLMGQISRQPDDRVFSRKTNYSLIAVAAGWESLVGDVKLSGGDYESWSDS